MRRGSSKRTRAAALAVALAAGGIIPEAAAAEPITLTAGRLHELSLRIYGFIETDVIADTTQGFTEELGNSLVPMRTLSGANNFAGEHHRTQMGARASRLGFELGLPKTDAGLQAQAVFEMDFLGSSAPNTLPGAQPGTQTDTNFYNNPAMRIRHAYMSLTYGGWNAKAGQYWSLLGWQPYYFPGETGVQPGPGQLYRRFAQMRLTHTLSLGDSWAMETAADAAKPAQANSGSPELHGGLRFASTRCKGASVSGSGTSMVGLSAAVSGAVIPILTDGMGNPTGQAAAFDVFVPLIPSSDGKDRSNNLIWAGEFVSGSGVGGLEYSGLTLGVGGISAAAPNAGSAVDSGIAGINGAGDAELIRYRAFRSHLQYSLPGGKWAVSGGYAQVEGRNLDRFSTSLSRTNALAPKIQYGYLSLFFDPLSWLRVAGQCSQVKDTYNDPANRFAMNNRLQFAVLFVF